MFVFTYKYINLFAIGMAALGVAGEGEELSSDALDAFALRVRFAHDLRLGRDGLELRADVDRDDDVLTRLEVGVG